MAFPKFETFIGSVTFRLILLFAVICFLPFLRECGEISYGFPFPVMHGLIGHDKLISTFLPALFLNIPLLIGLYLLTKLMIKNIEVNQLNLVLKVILIYHAIIIFSYCIFLPSYNFIYDKTPEHGLLNSILTAIMAILYYLVNPFSDLFNKIPLWGALGKKIALFGDTFDMAVRLNYILANGALIWVTLTLNRFLKKRKPRQQRQSR